MPPATGNITVSVRNETISNSSNQKLLGVRFNSNFRFDDHVASLCKKASQTLNFVICGAYPYKSCVIYGACTTQINNEGIPLFSVWILSTADVNVSQ